LEAIGAENDSQLGVDASPVWFDHSRAPAGLPAKLEQICAATSGTPGCSE